MKILVNLYIPVLEFRTDLFIPSSMKINDLIHLLVSNAQEASSKFYPKTGQEVLCHAENAAVLIREETVESSGIRNGHHIILI